MDVSVILPVVNEAENLRILIPRLIALLDRERLTHEIVVIDGVSSDGTRETAQALGARVVAERRRGYAGAMETGIAEARGDYVLTLDADQSHDPDFIVKLWRARTRADIVVASRYVLGGVAYTGFVRRSTSWLLNAVLRRILSMPVRDMSSGYRLYRREVLANLELRGAGGNPGQGLRRRLQRRRSSVHIFSAGRGPLARKAGQLWMEDTAFFAAAVENPQLARVRRLRRTRLLQPDSAAALLATPPPSHHRVMGAWRGPRACRGMRFEPDRAEPQQRDRHGQQLCEAPLSAPPRNSAGQRLRFRAAVQG